MTLWRNQTWKHISRYEYTIASSFGVWPLFVLLTILHTYYHANIDYLRNWQTFMIVTGFVVMFYCTASAGLNYLWINLGFFPPIPFGAYTIGSITYRHILQNQGAVGIYGQERHQPHQIRHNLSRL